MTVSVRRLKLCLIEGRLPAAPYPAVNDPERTLQPTAFWSNLLVVWESMQTRVSVILWAATGLASISSMSFAEQRMQCLANFDTYRADRSDYALMTVIGSGSLHFVAGVEKPGSLKASCPDKAPACQELAYLLPSDVVLARRPNHSFVCALFGSTREGRSGYLPMERLNKASMVAAPLISSWKGTWKNGDDTIKVAVRGDRLLVDGQAWWPSEHPEKDVSRDLPNEGDFRELVRPIGNVATITPADNSECQVALKLVAPYLIVTDNAGGCGGMNVRFNGVYLRRK